MFIKIEGHTGGGPKVGVPQNRWFVMEIPVKKDDLFSTPMLENLRKSYLRYQYYPFKDIYVALYLLVA